jgi:hypothetical protein
MTCQCPSCLEILTREATDSFSREFRSRLIEGSVVHIGTTPDGRAIYRQW